MRFPFKENFAIAALSVVLLFGCTKADDTTGSSTFLTCNLITPANGSGSYATTASYTFSYNFTQGTVEIGTKDLVLDRATYSFNTDAVKFDSRNYQNAQGSYYTVTRFDTTGGVATPGSVQITEMTGFLTDAFGIYNIGYPGLQYIWTSGAMTLISYKAGDYFVQTFPQDATYFGKSEFTKADPKANSAVRVVIDPAKSTADIAIYGLKIEGRDETLNLIAKDLKVNWGDKCYSATGEKIVPLVLNTNKWEENSEYAINEIKLDFVGKNLDSTNLTCSFADGTGLTFKGSYLLM